MLVLRYELDIQFFYFWGESKEESDWIRLAAKGDVFVEDAVEFCELALGVVLLDFAASPPAPSGLAKCI